MCNTAQLSWVAKVLPGSSKLLEMLKYDVYWRHCWWYSQALEDDPAWQQTMRCSASHKRPVTARI